MHDGRWEPWPRFRFVTGRRPVVEWVFARAAAEHEGVQVRRGVGISDLVAAAGVIDGIPHVTGVRTTDGQELAADLVVDASGRRTKSGEWLRAIGARPPHVESEDCGFVYHTRYFKGPKLPTMIGPPVSEIGTISLLTLPGDNGTWGVTVWAASADTALRNLRHTGTFTDVVRACPLQAHWTEGEPITEVLTMAGILDRYRRFVVDGAPVATGVVAVGDAWACTNPSAGRGLTVGLLHAQRLRDVTRSSLDDPARFARDWDKATEAEAAPYYRDQIAADRSRIIQMEALRNGEDPPPPDPARAAAVAVEAATNHDAEVFRGALEMRMCLALPHEVLARSGFMDKARAAAPAQPMTIPGPDRPTLLSLLA